MEIISHSAKETLNIGKRFTKNLKQGDIICLFGQLGAGKTVFVKGIASGLGIEKDKVISPSFVLIRQYRNAPIPLYHFDLYRLKEPKDILALGYEEYLYNEGISVIEWADRLKYLLPREFLKIELFIKNAQQRKILFIPFGRHYKEVLRKVFI